jgi:hypothetical protein
MLGDTGKSVAISSTSEIHGIMPLVEDGTVDDVNLLHFLKNVILKCSRHYTALLSHPGDIRPRSCI